MLHPNEDTAAVVASGHYWHKGKVTFHALQLRLCFQGMAGQLSCSKTEKGAASLFTILCAHTTPGALSQDQR